MKEPLSTLVSLCVAFTFFNYQINGETSYENKQVNLAENSTIFQTVREKYPGFPNQQVHIKNYFEFSKGYFCTLAEFEI